MPLHCTIDLSKFYKQTEETVAAIHRTVHESVKKASQAGAEQAKEGKFKDRTGQLRGNITAKYDRSDESSAYWEICSPMPYSIFVESGTRPHDIYPKAGYNTMGPLRRGQSWRAHGRGPHEHIVGRGRALRWVSGGRTFFAAHVHHPGSKAYPFMGPGMLKAEAVLYAELEALASRLQEIWN